MNNNKRKIILGSIMGVLIGTLVSVSYAFFTYSRTGTSNSQLVAGQIYMHYTEDNTLTIEDTMPRSGPITNKYFEFTISGKNTTTDKDIWYDVVLSHGTIPTSSAKTENDRIEDKYLRFRLVEVISGSESIIEDNIKYNTLTNRRIYVNKILHGTEPNHTYRLYMWIDNSVGIGNTNEARYSISDWNNLFASIKVNVTGDFNQKYLTTNPSCFTTTVINEDEKTAGIMSRNYDTNCGLDVIIPSQINGYTITKIDNFAFVAYNLTSVELPNTITYIGNGSFNMNKLTSVIIPDSVTTIGQSAFFGNQLTNIEIPNSVTIIEDGAFGRNKLTSVKMSNNIIKIGSQAFTENQLTSIFIPSSITSIGNIAFRKSSDSNPNFASITIDKSCEDIKNNLKYYDSHSSEIKNYYPWLSLNSPYYDSYSSGVTIYGINNEICDTFE